LFIKTPLTPGYAYAPEVEICLESVCTPQTLVGFGVWSSSWRSATLRPWDYSMQYVVNSSEVSAPVAPSNIVAPQIGMHRRLWRVPHSKM